MDRIHNPESRPYISPEINLSNVLAEWVELGVHKEVSYDTNLASVMNVPSAIFKELECVCSVDNLTCVDEPINVLPFDSRKPKNEPINYVTPTDHNLQCLKIKQAINARRASQDCTSRKVLNEAIKHRFTDPKLTSNTNENAPNLIKGPELLLTVTLYRPYQKRPGNKYIRDLQMEQQMIVLGSQKLTELRDRFTCLADISVSEDFSENPDLSHLTPAKEIFTSGFFYINGTFYNDMRNCQSRDNSKAIIEWANQYPDMEIGPFENKLMEETRFLDLTLRLGYPYVYQHQGDCEHLLVFQDVRLMNRDDCQNRNKYPILACISSRRRVICMVCHLLTARWVTTSNQRVPADPFFFCDSCFRQFNYDKNGKKIGQFFAQPYMDRTSLL